MVINTAKAAFMFVAKVTVCFIRSKQSIPLIAFLCAVTATVAEVAMAMDATVAR